MRTDSAWRLGPIYPQRTPHSMSLPYCPSTPGLSARAGDQGLKREVTLVVQLQMLAGDPGRKDGLRARQFGSSEARELGRMRVALIPGLGVLRQTTLPLPFEESLCLRRWLSGQCSSPRKMNWRLRCGPYSNHAKRGEPLQLRTAR